MGMETSIDEDLEWVPHRDLDLRGGDRYVCDVYAWNCEELACVCVSPMRRMTYGDDDYAVSMLVVRVCIGISTCDRNGLM